jgi:threonine/homoserine/homoserine lactone efflux protein
MVLSFTGNPISPAIMSTVALLSIVLTFFIVAVAPGPATVSTALVAMAHGRQAALNYGAGLSCGLAFWGIIAASGLGLLLHQSVYLLSILKFAGGVYLLWLAWCSAVSATQGLQENSIGVEHGNGFVQGLLLNLSNPKAVLAWIAALSVGLDVQSDGAVVALATGACVLAGVVVYIIYAVVFSLPGMMLTYQRVRRWIDAAAAGFFALAGLGLIQSSFARQ